MTKAVLVVVGLWGLGTFGVFEVTDGLVYDRFLRMRNRLHQERARVLLVEVGDPAQLREEGDLLRLVEEIDDLGATQIVFAVEPPESAADFYARCAELGNVVFARGLTADPLNPQGWALAPPPEEWQQFNPRFGVIHNPPTTGGVCRRQYAFFPLSAGRQLALEARVASEVLGRTPAFDGAEYLVNFSGASGALPHVSLEQLLEGALIPELVEGRVALVGLRQSLGDPGLYTPTTKAFETMSLLEYQGHAVNTLLSGRMTTTLDDRLAFFFLAAVAVLASLTSRLLSVQIGSWLTAVLVVAYAAASLGLFLYAHVWLPVTAIVLCHVLLFLATLRQRALELTRAMRRLISDSSSQLRDKYWPSHLSTAKPSWSLVANMINQTLDLNKLIFLEAQTRKARLKEILALHCSLSDIVERRREYTRSPYVDALRAKAPIRVEKYLRTKDPSEVQYLAPLVFCGKLLGFWALGIKQEKMNATPDFEQLLREYTARISELLYHAVSAQEQGSIVESWKNRFAEERTESTYQGLRSTLGLLDHRLFVLERLINEVNAGVIVYDIFGRVLQINQVMLGLLTKEELAPFEMTALDLILALSDYDLSKSRKLLRRVIVENKAISFPVTFRSKPTSRFFIYFKPLLEDDPNSDGFGVRSVLCELVDTTATAYLAEMKGHLTGRLGLRLRTDLAAIDMSSSLLKMPQVEGPQRQAIANIVQSKVQSTIQALSECQQYLAVDDDVDELERFPVDPNVALDAALDTLTRVAEKRGVEVRVNKPNFVSYVFAASKKLQELFQSIGVLLTEDASDDSTILLRVTEGDDIVAFDFSDMGFGIPNELLQEYVFGDHPLASKEFQKLQQAAKWVESWGGVFEAASGVGVGMHFTVHLVKFI